MSLILILLSVLFSVHSCDYKAVGVPGPDSTYFLMKNDYILKDSLNDRSFKIESIKDGSGGEKRLVLRVNIDNYNLRTDQVQAYRLLTIPKNQYASIYSAKEYDLKIDSNKYNLCYDLYAYDYIDKMFLIVNESPLEVINVKFN